MSETVAIGLIDRAACAGCVSEHESLTTCCTSYVDLESACVTCDSYLHARAEEGKP